MNNGIRNERSGKKKKEKKGRLTLLTDYWQDVLLCLLLKIKKNNLFIAWTKRNQAKSKNMFMNT